MAYQLAQAYVQIVPSMKGVGKAIESAFDGPSKSVGQKAGQNIGSGLSAGFAAKAGAVAGIASQVFGKVASVVTGSLNSAISRADQMNNFPKVMKNLGYSADDAAASVKKISSALDGLPTTSSSMTGMVQQLAPLTSNLDEATNISLAFNNAMLAGGASTMEQQNALTQYTQMLSAGKVDMQAWRSIQAAMPGQLNQVAEAMLGAGKNGNDLYEAMKNGSVSFDDFNKKIMELNQNGFGQYASFAQQAKDATQGIGTAMENVQNRVAKAVQKVIDAVGVENIAGAINGFSSQFGRIGDAAAGMVTGVKGWFGKAAQSAQPLVSVWKSDFGQLGMYLKGLAANAQAFGGSLLDVVTNGGGFQNFLMGLNNIISPLVNWWIALTRNVSIFIGTLSNSGGVQAFLCSLVDLWQGLTQLDQGLADAVTGFIAVGQNGSAAASIGQLIGDAFNASATLVKSLASTLQSIGDWASGNGDVVRTVIAGIAGGFAAFKAASLISAAVTALKSFDVAAKIAAAGQWVLNAAMNANPIVLVVTAIAALVSGLVWFCTQTEAGRQLWAAFTVFLQTAWQNITDFFQTTWQNITQWFSNAAANIQNGWNALTAFIGSIPGRIQAFFASIGQWFVNKFNEVRNGIANGFDSAVSFVSSIPGRILSALGNLGGLLWNAGASIMHGFLNGLKSVWNDITSFVGNIAGWIADHKGPLSYDRRLLIPAGEAIMGGFRKSLNAGWQQVQSDVAGMNIGLANGFTLTPPTVADYAPKGVLQPTANTDRSRNTNVQVDIDARGSDPEVLFAMAGARLEAASSQWG